MNNYKPLAKMYISRYLFLIIILSIFFIGIGEIEANSNHQWVCWILPPKEALVECRNKGTCDGNKVLSWSQSKEKAINIGIQLCNQHFQTTKCYIDYCEIYQEEKP